MLADPRAQALVKNFAGQWLFLRNLQNHLPDSKEFPNFDDNLRQAFWRETELLFEALMREDRSVLDLLTADYTFVNERLARHYGIPNVYGSRFRRVPLADVNRRGLLGHGSILTVTSYPDRTSPVLRGKWILENILGTPPPPPPAEVPAFPDNPETGKALTIRERTEAHRKNPACASCHRVMDPLGFSLENFDAIGQWRTGSGRHGGYRRSAGGWHQRQRACQPSPGAGETTGAVRRHHDGKTADLRARPGARTLRYAGGPVDCTRVGPQQLPFFDDRHGYRQKHAVSDEGATEVLSLKSQKTLDRLRDETESHES